MNTVAYYIGQDTFELLYFEFYDMGGLVLYPLFKIVHFRKALFISATNELEISYPVVYIQGHKLKSLSEKCYQNTFNFEQRIYQSVWIPKLRFWILAFK